MFQGINYEFEPTLIAVNYYYSVKKSYYLFSLTLKSKTIGVTLKYVSI